MRKGTVAATLNNVYLINSEGHSEEVADAMAKLVPSLRYVLYEWIGKGE